MRPQGPMLRDGLWRALVGPPRTPAAEPWSDIDDGWRLCRECIERRLRRPLRRDDLRDDDEREWWREEAP